MKFLRLVLELLLISILVLQPEAFYRLRHRSSCSAPPIPAYTHKSGCNSPYTQGERCDYRCLSGYIPVSGSTNRTCSDGRWPGTNLVCRKAPHCSTPPYPAYTYRRGCSTPYKHGERCTYRCLSGYFQVSGSTSRTCSYGTWTGTNLVCGRIGCPTPPSPANTIRSDCISPYTQGDYCTYQCHDGYILSYGTTIRICSNGFWTGSYMFCSRGPRRPPQGCSTPPSPAGTTRSGCYSPYTQGERCTYRCRSGYTQVSGSTTRTCSSNGHWTGTNLVCMRGDLPDIPGDLPDPW